MSNQAKLVLWIGLALIVVQLVQQWQTIKAIIFTPSTPITGSITPTFNPLSAAFGGGFLPTPAPIRIPHVTRHPGLTFPKIGLAAGTGLGGNRIR